MAATLLDSLIQKIVQRPDGILIPNDPEMTGTGDWQGFEPLSFEENQDLKHFVTLLKNCDVIVDPEMRTSFIDGVYKYKNVFFIVFDEWCNTSESIIVRARPISRSEARRLLIKEIEHLKMSCFGLENVTNIAYSEEQILERKAQIEELVSTRINQTTLSKFDGWDTQARKNKVWEQINDFVERKGIYPSDIDIFNMHGMQHPQVKKEDLQDATKKLLSELRGSNDQITLPIDPKLNDTVTKADILTYEAVEEICRNAEYISSSNGPISYDVSLYRLGNLYFERTTVNHLDPYNLKDWTRIHKLRQISKDEANNLKEKWNASSNEQTKELLQALEIRQKNLKRSESLLKNLDQGLWR